MKTSTRHNLLLLLISTAASLIILELALGYYKFHKIHGKPAIWYWIERKAYEQAVLKEEPCKIVAEEENPFINYGKKGGSKLHPFIDFSGAYAKGNNYGIRLDYFGFRNDADLYFEKKDYILIVITGGSEAAGYTHKTTIAQNLENILNANSGCKFKVLNLAMNSYCVANEIGAYLHLAWHLKPEFVISHSGWNDFYNARMNPYKFKLLALNYHQNLRWWLPRLYYLREYQGREGPVFNKHGYEVIVDAYLKQLEKYKTLVNANGGEFIAGIQGYNKQLCRDDAIYKNLLPLYEELGKRLPRLPRVIDFTKTGSLQFADSVHSDEESSLNIARSYAAVILAGLKGKCPSPRHPLK